MRIGCTILALCGITALTAQDPKPEGVRLAVDDFFEVFHARDTSSLRAYFDDEAQLQSIGRNASGMPVLRSSSVAEFLTSIASIPDSVNFRERLLDYRIQIDGEMAHAWTPYEFYLGETLHHCGVNSFQFFYDGKRWRILHLVDTRRIQGCKP